MIKLLSRLFIKDHLNYGDTEVRSKYGLLCGFFGIFLNILLFSSKIIAGLISKSVALTADAFNNLSDAASSAVQLLGFKLSSKKPDSEHPFGHGRIEYISGLIISFLIIFMGIELLRNSISSLFKPSELNISLASILVMTGAILVKLYMYIYNHSVSKKINSVAMEAVAKDSLSDMISTFVVIVSTLLSPFTDIPVDGIGGIIVALFIFYTGYTAVKETMSPLLGTPPSKELVKEIEQELLKHDPIVAMHDIIVHDYGPGRRMISLHAEVPGDRNIFELHDVIDNAEASISNKFNCTVVIHMDPIDLNNTRLTELKSFLKNNLSIIDDNLQAHDIRMVPGTTHTNLIFDVVKPYTCTISDTDLKQKISRLIKAAYEDVSCVITIDAPFV